MKCSQRTATQAQLVDRCTSKLQQFTWQSAAILLVLIPVWGKFEAGQWAQLLMSSETCIAVCLHYSFSKCCSLTAFSTSMRLFTVIQRRFCASGPTPSKWSVVLQPLQLFLVYIALNAGVQSQFNPRRGLLSEQLWAWILSSRVFWQDSSSCLPAGQWLTWWEVVSADFKVEFLSSG